jgi:TrmH family RNA methyltransferase
MNETITSRQNGWFKRMDRAMREHGEEIVIEGPKQVDDAIRAGWKPIAVVGRDLLFSDALVKALSDTKTSQGVLALFERPRFTLSDVLARRDTVAVALDGVQDPGNVGTIVRLAAAFDASGVILLPGCADAYSPKAIRASVGAALSVPIVEATAAEVGGATLIYADGAGQVSAPPASNAIFVFGSEGSGISAEIRRAGRPIAISMSDRVESLNVAAAAAILLSRSYEARR